MSIVKPARLSLVTTLLVLFGAASAVGWACGDDKPAEAPTSAASASASGGSAKAPDSDPKAGANGPSALNTPQNPAPPSTVIGSAQAPSPAAPGFKTARVAVEGGQITTSEEVTFVPGTANLAPNASALLDEVAQTIKAHPELKKIRVEGHCAQAHEGQAQLTSSQLEALSKDRAQAVVGVLVSRGVDSKLLVPEGFGVSQPLMPGTTPEAQAKNRRVDFVIMEKK